MPKFKILNIRTTAKACLPFAAAALLSAPALAADGDRIDVSVSYSGKRIQFAVPAKHLNSEAGVEKLYIALEKKAEASCKRTIPTHLGRSVNVKRCMARLMDGFIADIDDEMMTARHVAKEA